MPSNDCADPTVQEADQRAERAKASLLSRLELLKHKVTDVREKLDLSAQIAKHPLPAVGIAFALGVVTSLLRTSQAAPEQPAGSPVKNAAFAALTAIGLRMVKYIALEQLGHVAKRWLAGNDGSAASARQALPASGAGPFPPR